MKRKLEDEQVDNLVRALIGDAAISDAKVNEIADSPAIWWGVQRQIRGQNAVATSPWPPIAKVWRWVMAGVPVAAALVISFLVLGPGNTKEDRVDNRTQLTAEQPLGEAQIVHETLSSTDVKPSERSTQIAKRNLPIRPVTEVSDNRLATPRPRKKAAEIKTDFIALSYARDPDSGQIVRIKVPRSMMVTLGLVAAVEKPSSLIDAEVVVGDDGLTRAIRFIR